MARGEDAGSKEKRQPLLLQYGNKREYESYRDELIYEIMRAEEYAKVEKPQSIAEVHQSAVKVLESMAAKNLLLRISQIHPQKNIRVKAARILIQLVFETNPNPNADFYNTLLNREFTSCSSIVECDLLLTQLGQILEILPTKFSDEQFFERLKSQFLALETINTRLEEAPETDVDPASSFTSTLLEKVLLQRLETMELYGLLRQAAGTIDPATQGRYPSILDESSPFFTKINSRLSKLLTKGSIHNYLKNHSAKAIVEIIRWTVLSKNPRASRREPMIISLIDQIKKWDHEGELGKLWGDKDNNSEESENTLSSFLEDLSENYQELDQLTENFVANPETFISAEVATSGRTLYINLLKVSKLLREYANTLEDENKAAIENHLKTISISLRHLEPLHAFKRCCHRS